MSIPHKPFTQEKCRRDPVVQFFVIYIIKKYAKKKLLNKKFEFD